MLRVISSAQVVCPNAAASAGAPLPGLGIAGEPQANAFPDKSGNASWAPEFARKVLVTNNLTTAGPMYFKTGPTAAVAASVNDAVINVNNPVLTLIKIGRAHV